MKAFVKKYVKKVVIILAVVVVITGAYLHFRPTAVVADNLSTTTVQQGTLSATVSAAGNIQSHQTANLSFGQSGTVKSISVEVGDSVKAEDVLAELDTADLELALRSAQVSLKSAEDTLAQTKNPNSEEDIASARAKVEAAQAAYDDVAAGASDAELASAQAQVTSAQAAYDAAVKSASAANSSLESAVATYEKARITLQQAQAAYDKVSWKGDIAASSEAATLQSATIDYNEAKAAYEALAATAKSDSDSSVASAAATLKAAQASLSSLKNQVTASDLASAKSTLVQAQNALNTLLAGSTTEALDIAQNNVDAAQIAVDQAKLAIEQAKVVAPFDGVITAVDVKVGQTASGTALSIADLSNLEIVVDMSEVDVNKVAAGQEAEITLDAVEGAALTGTVSDVAPAGTETSGVVSYPVTVALTKTVDSVKTGMTANLNIVVDKRENVLTVPNKAIKTVNKQKVVTLLIAGQQVQTPVTTGLSNDTSTEITSGLKAGDVVVLTSTTTTSSKTTSGGSGMGGGMPPM